MADLFDSLDAPTAAAEGGYVNNPNDAGGPTNRGITQRVARQNGYAGDMRDLTADQAKAIRRAIYYARPGIYLIAPVSQQIASEVYDSGINCGTGTAVMWLQRALNVLSLGGGYYPEVKVDGAIGSQTASALSAYLGKRGVEGVSVLLKALNSFQGAYYLTLAEAHENDLDFIYGWLRARVSIPS